MAWKFVYTTRRPAGFSDRGWTEGCKTGMRAVGEWWEAEIKMRHFEADAASRYGYQPRTERYLRRKKAIAAKTWRVLEGGQRDLVLHGQTRGAVRMRHTPRVFPTRLTIHIPTPSYVQMRPRTTGRPNLGEELTRLTADEVQAAERLYATNLERFLDAWREARTISN
jgi:hypothetical protein